MVNPNGLSYNRVQLLHPPTIMAETSVLFTFHDLKDRVIVLTGAANGIGRVLALGLAEQGCRLILIDKDAERLKEIGE